MLIIRNRQLDLFRDQEIGLFTAKMVARIAEQYPARFAQLGQSGVRDLISKTIERGREFNIVTAGAVAALIDLVVQFGEGLAMSPSREWAMKLLAHPSLPDYIKLDLVRERLTAGSGGRPLMSVSSPLPAA
ncbi:hypothetical protein GTP81_24475 [Rugamonas sp. FT107W]|uniref:Uncharacterized protein n=1 Tax=Duganella vulcania TaxID=2692166 RepID=A0A845HU49_9BURK|nr:hypothetical protein [Duganella vulcania]MYN19906.1 hypothetical protein [Duganella vulcania]